MRGVDFYYHGTRYRLALSAGALFELYELFGSAGSVLDPIDGNDAKAWNNACTMAEILSRAGEAQRRYLCQDGVKPLAAAELMVCADPTDVGAVKGAIRAACAVGFDRSVEDESREVDLVLQDIEQKKTEKHSGRGFTQTLFGWAWDSGSWS